MARDCIYRAARMERFPISATKSENQTSKPAAEHVQKNLGMAPSKHSMSGVLSEILPHYLRLHRREPPFAIKASS